MKNWIKKHFTYPLYARNILWEKKIRIFCDGGEPIWNWIPRIHRMGYDKYWGMIGFWMTWLGRQICFSFGEDKMGLYSE